MNVYTTKRPPRCLYCNYELSGQKTKYCSVDCQRKYIHREKTKDMKCDFCGTPMKNKHRYCSPECRDGMRERNERLSGPRIVSKLNFSVMIKPTSKFCPKYDSYRTELRDLIQKECPNTMLSSKCYYSIIVDFYLIKENRGDIDNFLKGLFDAMQDVILVNDMQIKRVVAEVHENQITNMIKINIFEK